MTEEEARSHPQRNLITRVLTGEREDTPDLSVREARPGDTYLLCSDGLTGVVTEETLAEVLGDGSRRRDPGRDGCIDLALKGGVVRQRDLRGGRRRRPRRGRADRRRRPRSSAPRPPTR